MKPGTYVVLRKWKNGRSSKSQRLALEARHGAFTFLLVTQEKSKDLREATYTHKTSTVQLLTASLPYIVRIGCSLEVLSQRNWDK
jgi:hypothetical protein